MQSMTGYGKAEYSKDGINLTVEIKTVNNRFLDLIPKYPRSFVALDDTIRKTVQSKIKRGRAELFITFLNTRDGAKTLVIDEGFAGNTSKRRKLFPKNTDLKTILRSLRCSVPPTA